MLKFKKDLQFVAFMHLFSVPIRVKKRISYTNQVVTNYGFLHDSRNYYIFKRSVKPFFICTFSGSFSLALISFLFGAHSLIGCHTQLSLCFTLFVYLSLSVFSLCVELLIGAHILLLSCCLCLIIGTFMIFMCNKLC